MERQLKTNGLVENRVVGSIWERRFWILRPSAKDKSIFVPIGIFAERRNDAEEFECIVAPLWDNYGDKYGLNIEDHPIYGVNMERHLDEYIYTERYPSTLRKRTPHPNNLNPLSFQGFERLETNWYDPIEILRISTGSSIDDLRFLYIGDKNYELYSRDNIPPLKIPNNADTYTITEERLNEIRDFGL